MTPAGTSNHPGAQDNGLETGNDGVSAGQDDVPEPLRRLADLIATSPHNLVARGERGWVYERHIAECVALAEMVRPAGRWMDLGTGGGLPGLVLAWRHPG